MSKHSLIIATGNAHKVEEFELLLKGLDFDVVSAKTCGGMPEVDENGSTFAANAQLKAEALRAQAPADAWVMADDSGLEVDALDGAPGIYSARYAGVDASDGDNVVKLLDAIKDVPKEARTARFRCVLCVIDHEGYITHYDGSCEGRIDTEVHGDGGFGYDPIFIPDGYSESFAQLGDSVKSQLSHRAKAVEWMRTILAERS
ncbi:MULTISPECIES: RdgB/HAM1 family non-canonical purine NTP pyrophosphatase [unclassified Lentimonas]|uniref:RdgB/HAM1 family non-canonical purine NTP pyrophosphatase n=1 Tax=unclassified Lentimonas TaxID=2630993 RepID=UPI001321E9E2|nr:MULTISPECIES: RdgB/HAM1 family non-canonical purine NTP pyrophosphatase [unclassified Lentimonas]CAA6679162.1 Nucleoside 5-triphosphatase RdgB (dHAPTP, dITP, XTP-specific) (EC [Lentimonas sp. CC4]CAA6684094.1 Nucleoside 5-triphosphatase RdgB (dHAPTP, dITP, XTP-specific) (EC [Lentimonas sp. CC6]CAA6689765.1 Nucleoside 5-triphosphatase RdgB (dHAPTP, dITP, XTP-specific) (EC [Lentimonas sp. CC10]CAA6694765.1 Nucleoside 5-triphosphatase RdgB (dHAPTP, dITP, XTP-specific) (EC [Lentimonas sp. CC19]